MRYSQNNSASAGFTLIEMLIIAPIIIIFIGVMIVMISSVTGDSLQAREKNAMAYNVQNALDLIETSGSRSATYPASTGTLTSPQGSNGSTAAFTVANNDSSSTDNDVLIIKTPATTTNPINSNKGLIYYNSPNSCASANVSENNYYPVTTVYFVSGGSLWQRTILPATGTPCSTPWQRASCAESQPLTGTCKAHDERLVTDVNSFSVQYLKANGTPETAANANKAKSVNVTISTGKLVAGKTIAYTGSTRSVALNGGNSAPSSITFSYTGSIQNWTVPEDVTSITILAKGAQGGSGTTYTGGLGASMQGTFTVTPGQVLKVLVGQQGGNDTNYKAGGGGGGSFVTTSTNSPLIVAGGGGGGGGNSSAANGNPGLTTTTGGSSSYYSGGTGGSGGGGSSGSSGGGGLTGNGTNSGSSGPGMSFTSGGAGGAAATCGTGSGSGGFGGGSGGEWCNQGAPGAGGGYSGGAGTNQYGVSGGGGSYNNGTNQTNASGVQSGNGQIKISFSGGEESGGGGGGGGTGTNVATFNYTGSSQSWQVPTSITTVQLETWGAEGGAGLANSLPVSGGYGGYAKGNLTVTPGETLYIYVGGKGADSSSTGGFNGGGTGGGSSGSTYLGSGGGGCSDVRKGGQALSNRQIVAGGGGGGAEGGSLGNNRLGGNGGGSTGGSTVNAGSMSPASGGGSQSAGGNGGSWSSGSYSPGQSGSLGQGGNITTSNPSGGGGCGYYGGGGGTWISGGGGSSYIGGVTGGVTTAGIRSGNGQVMITY